MCWQAPPIAQNTPDVATSYQTRRSLCMVLCSLSVEGLIEGNIGDSCGLFPCLFLPYVHQITPGVDEQLLKIAVAGLSWQVTPLNFATFPQTYSDSLAAINSILWLCYQPPNLWVTKGNKLHASEKKNPAHFIHQSVGQDCFLAKDLTCCFNNSKCPERPLHFLYRATVTGACSKIWLDY